MLTGWSEIVSLEPPTNTLAPTPTPTVTLPDLAGAPANGFTVDEVTQGQIYPSSEVDQYLHDSSLNDDPGITEEQALRTVEEAVNVMCEPAHSRQARK
jgi:hypothetical protein